MIKNNKENDMSFFTKGSTLKHSRNKTFQLGRPLYVEMASVHHLDFDSELTIEFMIYLCF